MTMFKTIYHIKDGPVSMYEIDARAALANFPGEWFATEGEAIAAATGDEGKEKPKK
jgi:hypothetical protein